MSNYQNVVAINKSQNKVNRPEKKKKKMKKKKKKIGIPYTRCRLCRTW
jgi:hypothetical protein